ncbi:hypothetical protein N8I71_13245 [Roseibacterium sp. SDUM158016]|uniref:hypothetical protein n=1 Tax=Roseicyclus sediminis TaxID=2980997 RepID=UPI0021CF96E8|nr:hypothetical protein [Roseibacterium sp. SDUM158016]MCU4653804.1 hypothetical protein [Roseibacterium sp. SDUM158016]
MAEPTQSALVFLWERHRPAMIALALAVIVAGFFAVRLALFTIYWSDPAHREQPLEGWMTPGYVAHSYGLDRDAFRDALRIPPGTRATFEELAAARGVPLEDMLAGVETAIAAVRSE